MMCNYSKGYRLHNDFPLPFLFGVVKGWVVLALFCRRHWLNGDLTGGRSKPVYGLDKIETSGL